MDSLPQRSAAFAMDHPDFVYAGLPAFGKVFRQQISDFGGPERMKVEFSGDRQRVGVVVHGLAVSGIRAGESSPRGFFPLQTGWASRSSPARRQKWWP